ncbi:hypothetical protein DFH06DRAFT_344938 [Mycena polygramma]|nr:hypothetical protein DFH06DRAFT_344938 [Mycena polygramma]
MASNSLQVSRRNVHPDRTPGPQTKDLVRPRGKWTVVPSFFLNPSPGRTLDRFYTSAGKTLGKHVNRAAAYFGLGPEDGAEKIKSYFGKGEQRVQRLEALRTPVLSKTRHPSIPKEIEKRCGSLMGYAMPTEAAVTQTKAFKCIVDVVTLFPGLRAHLLGAKCMRNIASSDDASYPATILALWARTSHTPPLEEWTFWGNLAATCLLHTPVSILIEQHSIPQLTSCVAGELSVIERLLVECDSCLLSVRYLGGILDLPGFWLDMGTVHFDVAKKLCVTVLCKLQDIGADILASGSLVELEPTCDYDAIDFLALTLLTGLSSWFTRIDQEVWAQQPWYAGFRKILCVLRGLVRSYQENSLTVKLGQATIR